MVGADVDVHVRHWRRDRQRFLVELAEEVGLSKSYLSNAERGLTSFSLEIIARLARALQIAPWQLVTFRGWPCPCCCHRLPAAIPPEDPIDDRLVSG